MKNNPKPTQKKFLITFRDKKSMNFIAETIIEIKKPFEYKSNSLVLSALEKLLKEKTNEMPKPKNSVWTFREFV